jgi:hypothetical protein
LDGFGFHEVARKNIKKEYPMANKEFPMSKEGDALSVQRKQIEFLTSSLDIGYWKNRQDR